MLIIQGAVIDVLMITMMTIAIIHFLFTDAPYELEFNSSDTITAVAGADRITVTCNTDCKPSCRYQWKKIGGSVVTNSRTLDLHPVQKVDRGSYVCVASNKHTTEGLSKQFTLIVNCK